MDEHANHDCWIGLTPRPETVYLLSMKKEDAVRCSTPILKTLLYSTESDAPTQFFSYTEHDGCISMIVDENIMPLFPSDETVQRLEEPWRVIQIDIGSSGIPSESGCVSLVGSYLSLKEITVYYLSTAQHDFVLVPKKHFETALDWLGKKLCSSKPNSITPPPRPPPSPYVHNLVTFPTQLFAASSERIAKCTRPLLKLIFFENPESRFFSFTFADDEISLIADQEHLALFPKQALSSSSAWRPIKRAKKAGFFETGVVSYISAPMAQAGVPVLYVSTYLTSFILVPSDRYDEAIKTWKRRDFKLVDHLEALTLDDEAVA